MDTLLNNYMAQLVFLSTILEISLCFTQGLYYFSRSPDEKLKYQFWLSLVFILLNVVVILPYFVTPAFGISLGTFGWSVLALINACVLIVNAIDIWRIIRRSRTEYYELQDLNKCFNEQVNKRMEDLEKLLEQQAYNFINLVHETKTPLTLINNYLTDYIRKHGNEDELKLVKAGVDKLTKDIVSLFDIERYNKGIWVYKHDQVSNFSELLKEIIVLFKSCYQKDSLFWSEAIEDNVFIQADPSALNRLVNNLIENAIKYAKAKGIIEIVLSKHDGKIMFSVRDQGQGIKPEFYERIFEPYFQIDQEDESKQGLGLGLPIVKKIVESLEGEIIVFSDPDLAIGTEFRLFFTAATPK